MFNKFSPKIQKEIEEIRIKIQSWKKLFSIKLEFYFDGWAIFLREKNVYPRCIVIFKSYESDSFSITSYDIHLQNYEKEQYKEIYSVKNIKTQVKLINELKDVIYGKDLGYQLLQIYNKTFLE
ncbi:MAG: hypothetical protein ACFFA0_11860 [Promethearchaeota archaeon]